MPNRLENLLNLSRPYLRRAVRRFAYVISVVAVFAVVFKLEIVSLSVMSAVEIVLAALLFILGLPLSVLLRVDTAQTVWGLNGPVQLLALATGVVLLNFLLIAFLMSCLIFLRGGAPRSEKTEPK